jgi:cytochrome d ubiquinol oxidase subunit I
MLFGWNRVGRRLHFAATVIVAMGTLISAFWILSANSFMQTPQGFRIAENGLLYPVNWLQIVFSPSFPYRFIHMVTAAYLTTAFVAGGIGSFYLRGSRHIKEARVMLGMAMIMAVFVAPMQLLFGDMHGRNTFIHQPTKVAAIEGLWETQRGAPLNLFGWPDQEAETTKYAVEIPELSSLILTHELNGEVKGLKAWPKDERPPVLLVFLSFRIMVGIGILMISTGVSALVLYLRKRLFDAKWFHYWCMAMTPAGFAAVLAGWFVTETGRQPYIIQGVMRTSEAVSPVQGIPIAISISAFVLTYAAVFGAGSYYIMKLIGKGPETEAHIYGSHGVKGPPLITDLVSEEEGRHV